MYGGYENTTDQVPVAIVMVQFECRQDDKQLTPVWHELVNETQIAADFSSMIDFEQGDATAFRMDYDGKRYAHVNEALRRVDATIRGAGARGAGYLGDNMEGQRFSPAFEWSMTRKVGPIRTFKADLVLAEIDLSAVSESAAGRVSLQTALMAEGITLNQADVFNDGKNITCASDFERGGKGTFRVLYRKLARCSASTLSASRTPTRITAMSSPMLPPTPPSRMIQGCDSALRSCGLSTRLLGSS